jgi:hypothetical protein
VREGHETFYNRFSLLLNPEDLGEEVSIELRAVGEEFSRRGKQ